jgi:hypothetical protein
MRASWSSLCCRALFALTAWQASEIALELVLQVSSSVSVSPSSWSAATMLLLAWLGCFFVAAFPRFAGHACWVRTGDEEMRVSSGTVAVPPIAPPPRQRLVGRKTR